MESVEPAVVPAGPGARRLLLRRTRELFRVYPKALVGDVEAVHGLRVAARRLRSALSLLAGNPDGRRARRADKSLRLLARTAGRGRDLDVALELLDSLPAVVHPDNGRLRRSLRRSRSRVRVLAREDLLDADLARLRRDLAGLAGSTRVDREVFMTRLAALRRIEEEAIKASLVEARRRPLPESMHRARRSARRLRYAAELSDLFDATDSGVARRWRGIQTRLGDIQDRFVLGAWLAARERRAQKAADAELAAAASKAQRVVKRDALRRTREFLASDLASSVLEPSSATR